VKEIKIQDNPLTPPISSAGDFVMSLGAPNSNEKVVIKIDSSIQEHEENIDAKNLKIRNMMISVNTEYTKELIFDFYDKKIQNICIDDKEFRIELIEIGEEYVAGINNQKFKYFKFKVEKTLS
jgi:hypothetical protein